MLKMNGNTMPKNHVRDSWWRDWGLVAAELMEPIKAEC